MSALRVAICDNNSGEKLKERGSVEMYHRDSWFWFEWSPTDLKVREWMVVGLLMPIIKPIMVHHGPWSNATQMVSLQAHYTHFLSRSGTHTRKSYGKRSHMATFKAFSCRVFVLCRCAAVCLTVRVHKLHVQILTLAPTLHGHVK